MCPFGIMIGSKVLVVELWLKYQFGIVVKNRTLVVELLQNEDLNEKFFSV